MPAKTGVKRDQTAGKSEDKARSGPVRRNNFPHYENLSRNLKISLH
jgi:hypothetical protein